MVFFSLPGLQSERQIRLEKVQFILAAFLLVLAAISRIDALDLPVPLFEWLYVAVNVLTALANLLLAFLGPRLTDIRKKNRLIRLVFLMTGFVLLMDALGSFRDGTQYLHFVKLLASLLFLLLAIFYNRIHNRRSIQLTDSSLIIRSSPVRAHVFQWKKIKHIGLLDGVLSIDLIDKPAKTFPCGKLPQQKEFTAALKKYSANRNITLDVE